MSRLVVDIETSSCPPDHVVEIMRWTLSVCIYVKQVYCEETLWSMKIKMETNTGDLALTDSLKEQLQRSPYKEIDPPSFARAFHSPPKVKKTKGRAKPVPENTTIRFLEINDVNGIIKWLGVDFSAAMFAGDLRAMFNLKRITT